MVTSSAHWNFKTIGLLFAILGVGVVASSILSFRLAAQNRSLKAELVRTRASLLPIVGKPVPPIHGYDLAGMPVTIGYRQGGPPTLLFLFSSGCVFCSETWPIWNELAEKDDPRLARLVFLNVGGGVNLSFLKAHGIDHSTVLDAVDPAAEVAYNMILAPELIEVGPNGTIVAAWAGKPSRQSANELLALVTGAN